jgi:3-oxoacyl-[acyl-carrier-protein] synthase II
MDAVMTGLGAVCSLGRGIPALWEGIESGRDGIAAIRRFSTEGIQVKIAGVVPDRNDEASGALPSWRLAVEYALDACGEAWGMAGLAAAGIDPRRIALVVGTSLGDHDIPLYKLTERIAAALGVRGPAFTISTACSSSTNALGLGLDLLRMGAADVVLAGGSDVLTPIMLSGFNALGVLSAEKCAPFSHPSGTTLGEGAGFVVLEARGHAAKRGAEAYAVLAGYGLSADAYHETSPDPGGSGVARALAGALEHAALTAGRIGYVNAHGTGTMANDPAEWRALRTVFGGDPAIPVSSTKSIIGHAQGAAGSLEVLATVVSMRRRMVPQTLNFAGPRRNGPVDPVASPRPRPHAYRYALCSNSAFGGANAAVVVGAPDADPMGRPAGYRNREVYLLGAGGAAAHGTSLRGMRDAIDADRPLNGGRVPDFPFAEILPGVDPRGQDPSARFLTAAAGLALIDAGLGVKRTRRDRIGLVMGVNRVSTESRQELLRSVALNGLPLLSATAFSRMVLNAPVGSCSKLLALGGPSSTVSTGEGSGLAAIIYAAEMLRGRGDADFLVAGGLDEWHAGPDPERHADAEGARQVPQARQGEGAFCAVLGVAPAAGDTLAIRAAGWGLAGPEGLGTAFAAALQAGGLAAEDIDMVFGSGTGDILPGLPRIDPGRALGRGEAFGAAAAAAAAALWLREGRAETVVVAVGDGGAAAYALILTTRKAEHG